MKHKRFNLSRHLAEEHHISPFSTYLREIVYGGNDGIITTFAVVAGFAGAQAQITNIPLLAVLLFGFANLFADGISMALGSFLSTQSEKDVYLSLKEKERHEIRTNPHIEKEEIIAILQNQGFTETQARELATIYATNENYWLDFMMDKEIALPNPEGEHAGYIALTTFLSFVLFGLIPLIPYALAPQAEALFMYSIISTAIALTTLGILRWKITRQHIVRSISETLFLGICAASVAYVVGTFFKI